jgi:hypothetical protein
VIGSLVLDEQWEGRFHAVLGRGWPCGFAAVSRRIWDEAGDDATREVLGSADTADTADTAGGAGEADASFCRALWCAVRHLEPAIVVETGRVPDMTTRFILEALAANRHGHLWSLGSPRAAGPGHRRRAIAVREELGDRWTDVRGSSRRRLAGVLRSLGRVDLFVHDSVHARRRSGLELERVERVLAPGGLVIDDDVDVHGAFAGFLARRPQMTSLWCATEDRRGGFGVARALAAADTV